MSSSLIAPLFDTQARIISLLGSIGAQEINLTVDQLLRLDSESSRPITLYLSSQGCGIIEAFKVIDTFSLLASPLTAVGLGLIEGAGMLILASAKQRILFPSTLMSVAGLWDLPAFHPSARRIGIHQGPDLESDIHVPLCGRLNDLIANSRGKIPTLFADQRARPEYLDANTCISLGLADAIVKGPERTLIQSQTKIKENVKNCARFPTL